MGVCFGVRGVKGNDVEEGGTGGAVYRRIGAKERRSHSGMY